MATATADIKPQITNVKFAGSAGAAKPAVAGSFQALRVPLTSRVGAQIVPGSVVFEHNGAPHFDRDGKIVTALDLSNGSGTTVGSINYAGTVAELTAWSSTGASVNRRAGLMRWTNSRLTTLVFRTPVAPLRPQSLSVVGQLASDGTSFNATFDEDGYCITPHVVGLCDYQTGVGRVWFRRASAPIPADPTAGQLDLTSWGIPGVSTIWMDATFAETLRYNAVAYTYIPLDADLVGVDPVRLPTDGRVPIYRVGEFVVVTHAKKTAPFNAANGQEVDLGRVRLSRVRVIGDDGGVITSGYTADLDAGTVQFTNVAGYSQPVVIEDRIEDMSRLREVQINGSLLLERRLTHAYPDGDTVVASALVVGDVYARVEHLFDQATWNPEAANAWSDSVVGAAATGTYNDLIAPIAVTNIGAATERWCIRFTGPTSYEVIGEHVGVIAVGNTATDMAPVNPSTGQPYFVLRAAGWGTGWAAGNVLRFNTVGGSFPVWLIRTIQQGPETVTEDSFTILSRGDVNR